MARTSGFLAAVFGVFLAAPAAAERPFQVTQTQQQQRPAQPQRPQAQQAQPAQAQQALPAQAPAAPAQPAAPQQPTRTEVLNFDNWSVTCQEFGDPSPRRNCAAQLNVQQQGTQNIILAWIVTAPEKTQLLSVMQLPTGVIIPPGIEATIGRANARKLGYSRCEPQRCEAVIPMDEAMVRDASAAADAKVAITGSNGQTITFSFPMKGFDKALAALRK